MPIPIGHISYEKRTAFCVCVCWPFLSLANYACAIFGHHFPPASNLHPFILPLRVSVSHESSSCYHFSPSVYHFLFISCPDWIVCRTFSLFFFFIFHILFCPRWIAVTVWLMIPMQYSRFFSSFFFFCCSRHWHPSSWCCPFCCRVYECDDIDI